MSFKLPDDWHFRSYQPEDIIFRLLGFTFCRDAFDFGFVLAKSQYRNMDYGFYYCGIHISCNRDMVVLNCSGKGCRTLERDFGFDWEQFFRALEYDLTCPPSGRDPPVAHISRIDIACDVLGSEKFTVPRIADYVRRGQYISRCSAIEGRVDLSTDTYKEVQVGSGHSDRFLRIYDKAMEQGLINEKWVRAELQMRNVNAMSFILNFYSGLSFGTTYYGVLNDFFRLTTEKPTHRHYDRVNIAPFWRDFVGNAGKIPQIYLPESELSFLKYHDYVETDFPSTLRTYLATGGTIDKLMLKVSDAKLNNHQLDLINEYERYKDDHTI